ncbi:TMEM165/GDT1 family protein [Agarivorans sp. 1_MG-2023]|uniref:TMEM165/GDT1 family protein n=1 Tax=Agarivorans sp. 1_MG-2023 TaxID=3062634 RepID=UPI0026E2A284|nr:TMEM165/GDT1 family protein [Agarivorans sp. 1_MG-2023]MDO6764163.1 TMEM165/GDT1 family protein [Agarivorans sp. 1_MG-2023]
MEALVTSITAVAIAEIGDKTQLLALLLACKFRKPLPIIAGIIVATLLNHAAAAWFGAMVQSWLNPDVLRWLLGLSFIAMAIWVLIPDKVDELDSAMLKHGPFMASLVLFFIAEIGDKTQVATVILAAKYDALWVVIAGTTIGMCIANIPVVLLGKLGVDKLPMTLIHRLTAILFLALGLSTLLF